MESPSPGRPQDLLFLLSWASQAFWAEQAAGLAELGISPRAYAVLLRAHDGNLTQRQIGDMCGVDKTTMVVTLDQLEAAGLARRIPAPGDRRARLIEVTPDGERVLAQARQVSARIEADVLATLSEEEREVFVRATRRLVDERFSGRCGPAC